MPMRRHTKGFWRQGGEHIGEGGQAEEGSGWKDDEEADQRAGCGCGRGCGSVGMGKQRSLQKFGKEDGWRHPLGVTTGIAHSR